MKSVAEFKTYFAAELKARDAADEKTFRYSKSFKSALVRLYKHEKVTGALIRDELGVSLSALHLWSKSKPQTDFLPVALVANTPKLARVEAASKIDGPAVVFTWPGGLRLEIYASS